MQLFSQATFQAVETKEETTAEMSSLALALIFPRASQTSFSSHRAPGASAALCLDRIQGQHG